MKDLVRGLGVRTTPCCVARGEACVRATRPARPPTRTCTWGPRDQLGWRLYKADFAIVFIAQHTTFSPYLLTPNTVFPIRRSRLRAPVRSLSLGLATASIESVGWRYFVASRGTRRGQLTIWCPCCYYDVEFDPFLPIRAAAHEITCPRVSSFSSSSYYGGLPSTHYTYPL